MTSRYTPTSDASATDPAGAARDADFFLPEELLADSAQTEATEAPRRAGDARLYEELAKEGFTGHRYELFERHLATYGLGVLTAWIKSGMIFAKLRDRGIVLPPWHESPIEEDVQDLATMTVAHALSTFRNKALIAGQWRSDGGASLTTYFIGTCLLAFVNVWRSWLRAQRHWEEGTHLAAQVEPGHEPITPEAEIIGRDLIRSLLADFSERDQQVVTLIIDGYSHGEIAEHLGTTRRAVEGMLYRIRTKAKARIGPDGT
jgi:DNA-directed RNA polymerase specialized sigma24 family protein